MNLFTHCPNCFEKKDTCSCKFDLTQIQVNTDLLPIFTTLDRGRYYVGRVLGFGGFGVVYAGYDSSLESSIAIKEFFPIKNQLASRNQDGLTVATHSKHIDTFTYWHKQFLKEAKLLHQLNDPSIVRLHNILENENATTYLIMERLFGNTLAEYLGGLNQIDTLIRFNKNLSIVEARALFTSAIRALKVLHSYNTGPIIHLDINPHNIFLVSQSVAQLKLLDFGLARKNSQIQKDVSSIAVGHPAFMAPEQIKLDINKPITASADCYSLGACMYAAVLGQAPTTVARLAGTPLVDLSFSEDENLIETIMVCLNLDPMQRPQHAMELNECLENTSARNKYLHKKLKMVTPIDSGYTILLKLPINDNLNVSDPIVKNNDIVETEINSELSSNPQIKSKLSFIKSIFIFLLLVTIIIGIGLIYCYSLPLPSTPRYQVNDEGTVLDTLKGLLWKRCSEGQTWNGKICLGQAKLMTWYEIMPNEQQKTWNEFGGQNNWRVPTIDELRTLVVCGDSNLCNNTIINFTTKKSQPTIDKKLFPNTPVAWFWSVSVSNFDFKTAQVIYFKNGNDYWTNRNNLGAVRLVRSNGVGYSVVEWFSRCFRDVQIMQDEDLESVAKWLK